MHSPARRFPVSTSAFSRARNAASKNLPGRQSRHGAILGMKKAGIRRQFDEIVTFAGVGNSRAPSSSDHRRPLLLNHLLPRGTPEMQNHDRGHDSGVVEITFLPGPCEERTLGFSNKAFERVCEFESDTVEHRNNFP